MLNQKEIQELSTKILSIKKTGNILDAIDQNNIVFNEIEWLYQNLINIDFLEIILSKKNKNLINKSKEFLQKEFSELNQQIINNNYKLAEFKKQLTEKTQNKERIEFYEKNIKRITTKNLESQTRINILKTKIKKLWKLLNNNLTDEEKIIKNNQSEIKKILENSEDIGLDRVVHYWLNKKLYNNRWKEIKITNIPIIKKILEENKWLDTVNISIEKLINWWDFLIINIIRRNNSSKINQFILNTKTLKLEWIIRKSNWNIWKRIESEWVKKQENIIIIEDLIFPNTWNLSRSKFNIRIISEKWISYSLSPIDKKFYIKTIDWKDRIIFIGKDENGKDEERIYDIITWKQIKVIPNSEKNKIK